MLISSVSTGKNRTNKITFVERSNRFFDVVKIEHTPDYTMIDCEYRGNKDFKNNGTITFNEEAFLEDFRTKETFKVVKIKGLKSEKLDGKRSFRLYFNPLKGKIRDANLYGSSDRNNLIVTGLFVDRGSNLRYIPRATEYGRVDYDGVVGCYAKYPEYETGTYFGQLDIEMVEVVADQMIITMKVSPRVVKSISYIGADFKKMVAGETPSYIPEGYVRQIINETAGFKSEAVSHMLRSSTYIIGEGREKTVINSVSGIKLDSPVVVERGDSIIYKMIFPYVINDENDISLVIKTEKKDYRYNKVKFAI